MDAFNSKKRLIKTGILSLATALTFSSTVPVFADEGAYDWENENPKTISHFLEYDESLNPVKSQIDDVIRDNYWVDLEKRTIKDYEDPFKDANETTPVCAPFPKYILPTNKTAIEGKAHFYNLSYFTFLGSVGIHTSRNTLDEMYGNGSESLARFGYKIAKNENGYYRPLKVGDDIPDRVNPFKFKEKDLLTQDEIQKPFEKLVFYGDLKAKDSKDSTAIDTYKTGDKLPLSFSLNASWFKRYMNGFTSALTRIGGSTNESVKYTYDNMEGMYDSQIVYTVSLPKGIAVNNPKAKISNLDGFTATTEVKTDDKQNRLLVVSLRLNEDKRAKTEKWRDIITKLNKIDTSNILIDIEGLSVSNDLKKDDTVTLKGTVAGLFDHSYTKNAKPDEAKKEHAVYRDYIYFAAKQNDEGRDAAAEVNKPNLISYTFKVTAPESDPVPRPDPAPRPDKDRPRVNTDRIDGKDRIETAIDISGKHYKSANTVIVVRNDLFPDSMTASVLAKLKDAPILLNPTNKLDPRVGAEIKRLGASEVIIVGGQNSISEKVREELRVYDADKNVERIAGHDRYGTSEMVARRVVGITGKKNKTVVASGEVFPDALAVGTYASREGYPILLVRKDLVPTQITKAIKDLEIKNTYIAGGYNTISKSTELKLPGLLERMAGKTRYETAIAIARSKFADSKEAYIASGEEFADALAISPISGKYNRPTLLVKSKAGQNKVVSDYIYLKNINRITAIGGYRYIPNDVLKELVN